MCRCSANSRGTEHTRLRATRLQARTSCRVALNPASLTPRRWQVPSVAKPVVMGEADFSVGSRNVDGGGARLPALSTQTITVAGPLTTLYTTHRWTWQVSGSNGVSFGGWAPPLGCTSAILGVTAKTHSEPRPSLPQCGDQRSRHHVVPAIGALAFSVSLNPIFCRALRFSVTNCGTIWRVKDELHRPDERIFLHFETCGNLAAFFCCLLNWMHASALDISYQCVPGGTRLLKECNLTASLFLM